jgi:dipeptidyl aminopeptidase/acylaminoacyl peptidase
MSTLDRVPELADRLERLVPAEVAAGDWDDVLARVRPHASSRRSRRRFTLKLVIALAVLLLLAGVAAATYVHLRGNQARVAPKSDALTVIAGGYSIATPPEIVEVLAGGRTAVVWRCPAVPCDELTSVAWASDGRHVAFTLVGFAMASPYLGLHILDTTTGRDIFIPSRDEQRLGCVSPGSVAWSPDGRTLAYQCFSTRHARSEIFLMRQDGTGTRRLVTDLLHVGSPTWSPDGRRIAFEGSTPRDSAPSIYVIKLNGSGRVLVARDASKPDWSADGSTIAYASPSGVKLVTPAGAEITPRAIAPNGAPAWSPDGSSLAIGTQRGVYLVDKTGKHLRLVTTHGGNGPYGAVRPAWYPGARPPHTTRTHTVHVQNASCKTCV